MVAAGTGEEVRVLHQEVMAEMELNLVQALLQDSVKLGERGKLAALGAGAARSCAWDCWNRSWGSSAGIDGAGAGVGPRTGAGTGLGAPGAGLGAAAAGIGAGVPSVGFTLGAKGDRVTRNLGAPSPGFTGAPCLGVSLRAGLGGVGKPSDMYKGFKEEISSGQEKDLIFGCVFF